MVAIVPRLLSPLGAPERRARLTHRTESLLSLTAVRLCGKGARVVDRSGALPGVPRREAVRHGHGVALPNFLALPERTSKPRRRGVTYLVDRGLPISTLDREPRPHLPMRSSPSRRCAAACGPTPPASPCAARAPPRARTSPPSSTASLAPTKVPASTMASTVCPSGSTPWATHFRLLGPGASSARGPRTGRRGQGNPTDSVSPASSVGLGRFELPTS